ncbi:hypothetical protein EPN96_01135 [bacterium]|nr:MAG: hypothetical protein EPN96_01135 [bacterium]
MKVLKAFAIAVLIAFFSAQAYCASPKVSIYSEPGEPGYFYLELPEPLVIPPDFRVLECTSSTKNVYLLTPKTETAKEPGDLPAYKKVLKGIYGRFSREGEAGIKVAGCAWNDENKRTKIGDYSFAIGKGAEGSEDLKKEWGSAWKREFEWAGFSADSSFASYFKKFAPPRYGLDVLPAELQPWALPLETPDLYSVFSSGAAIHESLQLGGLVDRVGRNRRPLPQNERSVPIEELKGPEVKSHPFAEMLGSKNPAESPLAGFVPQDQYYVLFRNYDKQIELSDLLRDSGGNLLSMTGGGGGREYDVRKKLEGKLCLEQTYLSRLFGSSVIGEVALTGSDPFFREGTSLTVIFGLKNPDVFKRHMESKYEEAAAAKKAVRSSRSIEGHEVFSILTPDGEVSSFYAQLGNAAIVSTSLNSLTRSLLCAKKKIPSLGEALDLKYIRTIFARGAEEEDIFIYLSDAHIRNLVGPRWKIEETRRLRCGGNLELLSNAALWRKIEKSSFGRVEQLASEKYLGETSPVCPDGGSYSIDAQTGAPVCSIHNRLGSMTAIGEIDIKEATAEETLLYGDFVTSYSRFWRQYFDPIAIRAKIGGDLRIETLILPLIENSWYDGIVSFTGKKDGDLPLADLTENTVVSLRSRIAVEEIKKSLENSELRSLSLFGNWLGDEFSLNVCDGRPFVELGGSMSAQMMRGGGSAIERLTLGYLVTALNLPVYLSAEVTDPVAAGKALPDLFLYSFNPRHFSNQRVAETYRLDDYGDTAVYSNVFDFGFVRFRLFTSIIGDRLIVATRYEILKDLIDKKTFSPDPADRNGNIGLTVYKENFDELGETTARGHAEDSLKACRGNLLLTGLLMEQAGVEPEKAAEIINASKGYSPQCPSGGRYLPDGEGLGARCSVHGTLGRAISSRTMDETAPVTKLLDSIERAGFTLKFSEEGLRAVINIARD